MFLLTLLACALSEDAFTSRYAEQACDWLTTCADAPPDPDDCLAEQQEGFQALLDRGCLLVAEHFEACLDERDAATCDDPFGLPVDAIACNSVLDCTEVP